MSMITRLVPNRWIGCGRKVWTVQQRQFHRSQKATTGHSATGTELWLPHSLISNASCTSCARSGPLPRRKFPLLEKYHFNYRLNLSIAEQLTRLASEYHPTAWLTGEISTASSDWLTARSSGRARESWAPARNVSCCLALWSVDSSSTASWVWGGTGQMIWDKSFKGIHRSQKGSQVSGWQESKLEMVELYWHHPTIARSWYSWDVSC